MTGRFFIIFVFLAMGMQLMAQQHSFLLKGKVLSAADNTPITGANVLIDSLNRGTITDNEGIFSFSNLNKGTYLLKVSFIGMQTDSLAVNLKSNETNLVFRLADQQELLSEIVIQADGEASGIQRLRAVENTAIYASKKNDLVLLNDLTINKAANISRQIYARVSGLNIWESDGAGVQLGIGGRGLSPNRNSNFNTRQNGYDISADALGYPESYYTPPAEAIERIEIVRGAASLQYGTQFGGMLNFKFKEALENKKITLHSRQTLGSFGFLNSFNSVSGSHKNLSYYSFYQYKKSSGWRPNEGLNQHNASLSLSIKATDEFRIRTEYTHSQYVAQQPGGLTDAEFEMNPRQSKRERNWFSVNWNLLAVITDIKLNAESKINNRIFGLFAGKNAIGNLSNINLLDFGLNRDLLRDEFKNWGTETRFLTRYSTFNQPSTLLIGVRYYQGNTIRKQGEGSADSDPDFRYLNPENLEGSDFTLPSRNLSLFAENVFNVHEKWSLTPGWRFEYINTKAEGYYRLITKDLAGNTLQDERINEQKENARTFLFAGLGISYRPTQNTEWYTNFSQNYRAINFNDIRVNVGSLVVDEDLSDEKGFTIDLGARGTLSKVLSYDLSLYHISYNDRIGTILINEPNPVFNGLVDRTIRFRTNIADAKIYGFESLVDLNVGQLTGLNKRAIDLHLFSNFSWTTASYRSEDPSIDGNEVELVPDMILKSGINLKVGSFSTSLQYGFTDDHFSDASNAIRTPTAIEGVIPSYSIADFSMSYVFGRFTIEAGINNLTDNAYFTRRATGYPGPGIIPSEGRSFYCTIGVSL